MDHLVSVGLMEARDNDGVKEVAVRSSLLCHRAVVELTRPALESAIAPVATDALTLSTLDLLAILHREGFEGTRERPPDWTAADTQKLYRLQSVTGGPRMYFGVFSS